MAGSVSARRILGLIAVLVVALPVLVVLAIGADIVLAADDSEPGAADAAIVLGAAVADDKPTPVFAERLRHAVELYHSGQVRLIVMTGGVGAGDLLAESEAGRNWALEMGVPPEAILVERQSHTTKQNFFYAAPLLAQHGLKRVLVVSDPLHMRRAMRMAGDLGLDAHPSPTPTSRYQSLGTQIPLLWSEIYFTAVYLVYGL